jgi:DNA-binding MarR family transcriptional regulator
MIVSPAPDNKQQQAVLMAEAVVVNLLRAAHHVEAGLLGCLRAHDLHPAHYNVLRILRAADRDGLGRNEIRDRLFRKHPDVTRLLDRMEAAGLVLRLRDQHDRRCTPTRLTPKGRRLVDSLDGPLHDLYGQMVGRLPPGELDTFNRLLGQVLTNSGVTALDCRSSG